VKQVEIASFFGVSRATIQDWKRAGCPLDGDLGGVVAWKLRRDSAREGIMDGDPNVPVQLLADLQADIARRRLSLNARIAEANSMPSGSKKRPNLLKVAVCMALGLEDAILTFLDEVPVPQTPWALQRKLLDAVDRLKDDGKEAT
jgi:phage terminase Nu1 subunit (DNA packaging protein)